MTIVLASFSILFVLAGAFFYLAGTIGLLRFPDSLSRLHALSNRFGLRALGIFL